MLHDTFGDMAAILERYHGATVTIASRRGIYTVTISHSERCAAAQSHSLELAVAAAITDAVARFDRGAA